MSQHELLQQLWDLVRSPPRFPDRLADILLRVDWVDLAQGLQEDDLRDLVESLDGALNILNPTSRAFCRCVSDLQRICAARELVPRSHILPCAPSDVGDRPVASGALADLYRGTLDGSEVYVKKVRVYSKDDPEKVKTLYREAIVWKRMVHLNIVPFYGVTLNPLQLVSDCMLSGDLPTFIKERPNANRLGLLNDVAEGLNYLHSRDVVHGGIMGTNVLINRLGRARLTNFALAEVYSDHRSACGVTERDDQITRWTAPELLNEAVPTKKADVFSFAMVMVEVFTGTVPFDGFQSVTSVVLIMEGDRPPRPTDQTLTDDMWTFMRMCWGQEPQSRPTMREVLQYLAPRLLQSLHRFDKSLPEFPAVLCQFYDSTERGHCIDGLGSAELGEFVNLLDEVLHIERLSEDLVQLTLHHLREVCARRTILPSSHVIPSHLLELAAQPRTAGTYEVRRCRARLGEKGNGAADVYIKVIRAEKIYNEFYGVVGQWVNLDHPNIIRCFGVTVDPLQIVTKWMPSGQAMRYVQEHEDIDRVRLLTGIASGLDYLHSHGLVHGNLKQENILVDSTGEACLSDIGFAKLVSTGESGFGWADASAGGCRWAAPEIFQTGKLSKESDVFSYGFVAAEIFTGEFLWGESDATEVRSRILKDDRPHLPEGERLHSSTTEVWRMSVKCWGKEPECRIRISGALKFLQRLLPQDPNPLDITGKSIQEQIEDLDKVLESDMISPGDKYDRLNILGKMCYHERSLPRSMVITSDLWIESTMATCQGGSADVYRGEHDGRPVAIKAIRLYVRSDQNRYFSRFCREAVVWRHLRHPNILPLLGATLDKHETRFALVSEWMKYGNINEFIRNYRDVNRLPLLIDVAQGVEYLHGLNLVHGDLKGANILIKNDRRACLADFGFTTIVHVTTRTSIEESLSTEASRAPTDSKVSLMPYSSGGTIPWMSPELLCPEQFKLDDNRPTTQSDCYALGMVVYEVLCGKPPFWDRKGHPMQAILQGVQPTKPAEATTLGFTDRLWWTVENCWLQDREMRPDVEALLQDLRNAAWAWDTRL